MLNTTQRDMPFSIAATKSSGFPIFLRFASSHSIFSDWNVEVESEAHENTWFIVSHTWLQQGQVADFL